MAKFEEFKPRSNDSNKGSESMMDVSAETKAALEYLNSDDRAHIGPDAAAVVRTALQLRRKDGLLDDTIKKTFTEHGIDKLGPLARQAYSRMLTALFTFGTRAMRDYDARKRDLSA